jgi:hypothetical protein
MTRTADAAYQEQKRRVERLMKELHAHLAEHAGRQAKDARNWGFVGDLNHYAEEIEEMLGTRRYYTTPDGVRMMIPEDGE